MVSVFLAAPAPRVQKATNLMGTSVPIGLRLFLLFGKRYYMQILYCIPYYVFVT